MVSVAQEISCHFMSETSVQIPLLLSLNSCHCIQQTTQKCHIHCESLDGTVAKRVGCGQGCNIGLGSNPTLVCSDWNQPTKRLHEGMSMIWGLKVKIQQILKKKIFLSNFEINKTLEIWTQGLCHDFVPLGQHHLTYTITIFLHW